MNYKEIAEKFYAVSKQLDNACFERVSELMQGRGRVPLDWDSVVEFGLAPICVTADLYIELVYGIRPNGYDDDFIIETEEHEVYFTHLSTDERLAVCELLDDYLSGIKLTDEKRLERMEKRFG